MPEIRKVRIQTAEPRGARYPGAVEEGFYIVEDDSVVLTDKWGIPIDKHRFARKIDNPDQAHSDAVIMLRQWKRPRGYDFNRPLHYPKVV